jgi:hypothetical protein
MAYTVTATYYRIANTYAPKALLELKATDVILRPNHHVALALEPLCDDRLAEHTAQLQECLRSIDDRTPGPVSCQAASPSMGLRIEVCLPALWVFVQLIRHFEPAHRFLVSS